MAEGSPNDGERFAECGVRLGSGLAMRESAQLACQAAGARPAYCIAAPPVRRLVASRVRITSGSATIVSNGVLGMAGDLVAMDDFLFAEPVVAVPEPATLTLVLLAGLLVRPALRLSNRPGHRNTSLHRQAGTKKPR